MPDVLNLQDQIASATAAQIAPEVLVWEAEKSASRPRVNPTAYDLMLRAIPAIYGLNQTGFRAAGSLLEKSLDLDCSSAACHSWLAHWYLLLIGQGWASDAIEASQHADQLAQRPSSSTLVTPAASLWPDMFGHSCIRTPRGRFACMNVQWR